ncbi:MAG: methylmalonyl-CoA mutase family protein [Gammaproteobacteria bacterium]|nr:methylmalonyl-CoA mutase family protein [Gammaproteobacteria bacterium]MDE0260556.1 methylmalonyl-CoA mutase family protein [Gammaproteobacteria bacterium]
MDRLAAAPPSTAQPIRVVTAASLFDGHDAAINVMRRILQDSGAEVIHLGHNRSALEIVECAVQEDAHAIAISSYQGGHMEFFTYVRDLLRERGADIRIFGGGGGTILPAEAEELHRRGIDRVFSPDDGRAMGLQGMIDEVLKGARDSVRTSLEDPVGEVRALGQGDAGAVARLISAAENGYAGADEAMEMVAEMATARRVPVLGVTGTGGSGKSSLVDELVRRYLSGTSDGRVAIISVDPSKRRTGGALLGDRIRVNAAASPRVYMRSLATRASTLGLSPHVRQAVDVCKAAGYDLVIIETPGIGQFGAEVVGHSDVSLYVMTAEYGAASQLEKIDMLDYADVVAINKFDRPGALDALRDVRKQYRRNHRLWSVPDEALPVYGTVASRFNDASVNRLYLALLDQLRRKTGAALATERDPVDDDRAEHTPIPPERTRYLAEIVEAGRDYGRRVDEQAALARQLYQLHGAIRLLRTDPDAGGGDETEEVAPELHIADGEDEALARLIDLYRNTRARLDERSLALLEEWPAVKRRYQADTYAYEVRGRTVERSLYSESLAGSRIPRVVLPRFHDWGEVLRWRLTENVPGAFPYTAAVFPLRRLEEHPQRMFAGEGGPERTNRRFHFLSRASLANRLSTAFDSVTLYGEDPDERMDIYGKVGNSGVSVASVDDAKKLYSGFNLANPSTSVSMTINGPAPMLLGFFLNAAIDQQCELHIRENGLEAEVEERIQALYHERGVERPRYQGALPEGNDGLGLMLLGVSGDEVLAADVYERIRRETLAVVRGTVQADILKEDQAQNTCIFSIELALRLMGDIQQYFIDEGVRNFYSVSISGYHIAEAGANPVTQLALTLANGFTYVEYYRSRGMRVDDFAPNLSFFFSNGMDPEYVVLGRVARRIWAKAMKHVYGANARSQRLKYHIQTSGRSLHAQEIAFNDIRTTLQALYALCDNCNSLHTNAYDEAITTPTEESVRRALAIQLVISRELGLSKNENPLQGSFIIEELTDLVEEAVMREFLRLSERGGVLGAMERMYQRGRIQDESLEYESRKHSGELPIVGVNTFLGPEGSPTRVPDEVIRANPEEKDYAIASNRAFRARNRGRADAALDELRRVALAGGNTFAALMEACKVCTLGQITGVLYEVGGQYRRNM